MSICIEYGCDRIATNDNFCNICYYNLLKCENRLCNNKCYDAKVMCDICFNEWLNETKEEYNKRIKCICKPKYSKKKCICFKKCKNCNLLINTNNIYCGYCNYSYNECNWKKCNNKILNNRYLRFKLEFCSEHTEKGSCFNCEKKTPYFELNYCEECAINLSYCRNCNIMKTINNNIYCDFCLNQLMNYKYFYNCECYFNKNIYKINIPNKFKKYSRFNGINISYGYNIKITKYYNQITNAKIYYKYIKPCEEHMCNKVIFRSEKRNIQFMCPMFVLDESKYCRYHQYNMGTNYNNDLHIKEFINNNYINSDLLKLIFSFIDYNDFTFGIWYPMLDKNIL